MRLNHINNWAAADIKLSSILHEMQRSIVIHTTSGISNSTVFTHNRPNISGTRCPHWPHKSVRTVVRHRRVLW